VFAETAAVTRKHRLGNLQSDASEGQESDFGHRTSCLHSKQRFPEVGIANSHGCSEDVNRAQASQGGIADELFAQWKAAQAKIVSEPEDKPWTLREFTASDLDGNLIRVFYDFRGDT
jgi:hypothetical protein